MNDSGTVQQDAVSVEQTRIFTPKLSIREVADLIAQRLNVEDEQVRDEIQQIVWDLGRSQSQLLCTEAMEPPLDPTSTHTLVHRFMILAHTKGIKKKRPRLKNNLSEHPQHEKRHSSTRGVAIAIANQLGETQSGTLTQIYRVVRLLGADIAQEYVQQTLAIEASGGLLLPDQSRRRTPGGVFFFLIRQEVSDEQRRTIFSHNGRKSQTTSGKSASLVSKSQQQQRATTPTALAWSQRQAILIQTDKEKGEVKTVKVTLIGRPGTIIQQEQYIITSMQQGKHIPSLPKGLPIPQEPLEPTLYTVCIAAKQWKKVQDVEQDKDDMLIVEGWQFLDKEHGRITVFATNTTTKKLQMAQKQAKSSA